LPVGQRRKDLIGSRIAINCTPQEKARIKMAASAMNMSYLRLILFLLDKRDRDIAAVSAAAGSPLHRSVTPMNPNGVQAVNRGVGRGYADEEYPDEYAEPDEL
jgi:hypothetical protein